MGFLGRAASSSSRATLTPTCFFCTFGNILVLTAICNNVKCKFHTCHILIVWQDFTQILEKALFVWSDRVSRHPICPLPLIMVLLCRHLGRLLQPLVVLKLEKRVWLLLVVKVLRLLLVIHHLSGLVVDLYGFNIHHLAGRVLHKPVPIS